MRKNESRRTRGRQCFLHGWLYPLLTLDAAFRSYPYSPAAIPLSNGRAWGVLCGFHSTKQPFGPAARDYLIVTAASRCARLAWPSLPIASMRLMLGPPLESRGGRRLFVRRRRGLAIHTACRVYLASHWPHGMSSLTGPMLKTLRLVSCGQSCIMESVSIPIVVDLENPSSMFDSDRYKRMGQSVVLVRTGHTDYHNPHPLPPTCLCTHNPTAEYSLIISFEPSIVCS
jgi:hypothetical protein